VLEEINLLVLLATTKTKLVKLLANLAPLGTDVILLVP